MKQNATFLEYNDKILLTHSAAKINFAIGSMMPKRFYMLYVLY